METVTTPRHHPSEWQRHRRTAVRFTTCRTHIVVVGTAEAGESGPAPLVRRMYAPDAPLPLVGDAAEVPALTSGTRLERTTSAVSISRAGHFRAGLSGARGRAGEWWPDRPPASRSARTSTSREAQAPSDGGAAPTFA